MHHFLCLKREYIIEWLIDRQEAIVHFLNLIIVTRNRNSSLLLYSHL